MMYEHMSEQQLVFMALLEFLISTSVISIPISSDATVGFKSEKYA